MSYIKQFEAFTKNVLADLKKTERTYLKRRLSDYVEDAENYRLSLIELIEYDISNFNYNDKSYDFCI